MKKSMLIGDKNGSNLATVVAITTHDQQYWYKERCYNHATTAQKKAPETKAIITTVLKPIANDSRLRPTLSYRTNTKQFYLFVGNSANSQSPRLCLAFRTTDVLLFLDDNLNNDDRHQSKHLTTIPLTDPQLGDKAHKAILFHIEQTFAQHVAGWQQRAAEAEAHRQLFQHQLPASN